MVESPQHLRTHATAARFSTPAVRTVCASLPAPRARPVVVELESPRRAALLVPLVQEGEELGVVITQRASSLRHHSDDWVFPGGGLDLSDASSAAGAVREASEELGLCTESRTQEPARESWNQHHKGTVLPRKEADLRSADDATRILAGKPCPSPRYHPPGRGTRSARSPRRRASPPECPA